MESRSFLARISPKKKIILFLALFLVLTSPLFNAVGILFYRFHQDLWAQRCYRVSLLVNPFAISPLHNLGLLEKDDGNHERAEQIYSEIISRKPLWGLVHKSLGASYHLQGRIREAKREYWRALSLDPRLASAWNNLGVIYFHQGKFSMAKVCYLEALSLDPCDKITQANWQRLMSNFTLGSR